MSAMDTPLPNCGALRDKHKYIQLPPATDMSMSEILFFPLFFPLISEITIRVKPHTH